MDKGLQVLRECRKKIEENPEEFLKYFDDYFSKMDREKREFNKNKEIIMEKVYQFLLKEEFIDDEDIAYFPEKYDFSREEFLHLADLILDYAEDQNLNCADDDFEVRKASFTYKSSNIVARLLIGQGSCLQMILEGEDFKSYKSFDWEYIK